MALEPQGSQSNRTKLDGLPDTVKAVVAAGAAFARRTLARYCSIERLADLVS